MKQKLFAIWLPWFALCATSSATWALPTSTKQSSDASSEQFPPSEVPKLEVLDIFGLDASKGYVLLADADVDVGFSVTIRQWLGNEPPWVSVRQNRGTASIYGSATRVDHDTWRIDGVRLGTGANRAKSLFLLQAFLPGGNGPKPTSLESATLKSSEIIVSVKERRLEVDETPNIEIATIDNRTVRTGTAEVVPFRFQLAGTYDLPESKEPASPMKPSVYVFIRCDAAAHGTLLGPGRVQGSLWTMPDVYPAGPSPHHKANCTLTPVLSLSPMFAGETSPVDVFDRDRAVTGPAINLRVEPVPTFPVPVPPSLKLEKLRTSDGRAIAIRQDAPIEMRDGMLSGSGTIDSMPAGGEVFLVATQIGSTVASVSAPALLNGNRWDVTSLPFVAEGPHAIMVYAAILSDKPLPRVQLSDLSRHQLAVSEIAAVRVPPPADQKAIEVELTHVTALKTPEKHEDLCATLGGYIEGPVGPTAAVYAVIRGESNRHRLVGPAVRSTGEWKVDQVCRGIGDSTLTVIVTPRPLGRHLLTTDELYEVAIAASATEGLQARVVQASVGVPMTPAGLLLAILFASIFGWHRFRSKQNVRAGTADTVVRTTVPNTLDWGFAVPAVLSAVLTWAVIFIVLNYLPLYSDVLRSSLHIRRIRAEDLARVLVVVTALAGGLVHLCNEFLRGFARVFGSIFFLGFVIALACLQAYLYFSYYQHSAADATAAMAMAAIAFFAAGIEAITVYFATRLLLTALPAAEASR